MEKITKFTRVQVEAPGITNVIDNHSGTTSVEGDWYGSDASITASADTYPTLDGMDLIGIYQDTYSIRVDVASTATKDTYVYTDEFAVAPGFHVGWFVNAASGNFSNLGLNEYVLRARVRYFNSSGVSIDATGWQSGPNITTPEGEAWKTVEYRRGVKPEVPANAVTARLEFQPRVSWNTNRVAGDMSYYLSKTFVATAAERGDVQGLTFTEGVQWVDLTGNATSIQLSRGGSLEGVVDRMEVGTMAVEIRDAEVTPANSQHFRKGAKARAVTQDNWGNIIPHFVGRIDSISMDYSNTKFDSTNVRVSFTAVDAVQEIMNTPWEFTYDGNVEDNLIQLRDEMNNDKIIFGMPSEDNNVPLTGTPVARHEGASLYDIMNGIADTKGAHWWPELNSLDYEHVLFKFAYEYSPFGNRVFSDDPTHNYGLTPESEPNYVSYTAIDSSFGDKAIFNVIKVDQYGLNLKDGHKVYGPYKNQVSVLKWGEKSAEITVGPGVSAKSVAASALERFAEARVVVKSVTFHADDYFKTYDLNGDKVYIFDDIEIYDRYKIEHGASNIDEYYHVLGIDMEITPEDWMITLRLRPVDQAATVTVVDPPGGPNSGPSDLVVTSNPFHYRMLTTDQQITSGDWIAVAYDFSVQNFGIEWVGGSQSHFVCPYDGLYLVNHGMRFRGQSGGGSTGNVAAAITKNGNDVYRTIHDATQGANALEFGFTFYADAGDQIQILSYQSSGSPLDLSGGTSGTTAASITFLS